MTTIILLDIDGVLVHPVGYKVALQTTVDFFAARMGQPNMAVTHDEIAVFEACGLTNEWDSGAMCVSALLLAALIQRPDVRRVSLEDTFSAIHATGITLGRPDFTGLAHRIRQHNTNGDMPSRVCLTLLREETDPANLPLLAALLGDIYALDTPTTQIFQVYALGHDRFAAAYGRPALFEHAGTLTTHDVPLLTESSRERLLAWNRTAAQGAAVFTARPSMPPGDRPGPVEAVNSPEGELAVELLGLADKLPLVAQGQVAWLADQRGRAASDYVKPSPVQALAAIGAAASGAIQPSLAAAADLVEHDQLSGPLAALGAEPLRVVVLEDSTGGIQAVHGAVSHLQRAGIDAAVTGIGVSPQADKRAALFTIADHVVDDVNAGLAIVLDT
ncbi:MAG: hypothetical protein JW966_16095 [Anaerolineae bacterium]|nr:hypothetical protein [Anaerolineae bacterium]